MRKYALFMELAEAQGLYAVQEAQGLYQRAGL
jgi:hypothetical protein